MCVAFVSTHTGREKERKKRERKREREREREKQPPPPHTHTQTHTLSLSLFSHLFHTLPLLSLENSTEFSDKKKGGKIYHRGVMELDAVYFGDDVCGNVVDHVGRCNAHLLSLNVSIRQHTSARAQHWHLREQHERLRACRH